MRSCQTVQFHSIQMNHQLGSAANNERIPYCQEQLQCHGVWQPIRPPVAERLPSPSGYVHLVSTGTWLQALSPELSELQQCDHCALQPDETTGHEGPPQTEYEPHCPAKQTIKYVHTPRH